MAVAALGRSSEKLVMPLMPRPTLRQRNVLLWRLPGRKGCGVEVAASTGAARGAASYSTLSSSPSSSSSSSSASSHFSSQHPTSSSSSSSSSSSASPASRSRDFDLKGWGRGRYYTKTHEWFEVIDEGVGVVGITQAAQQALGEVVFCRLPKVGDRFKTMDTLATLEAVKTVGEVKSPVYGEVIKINPRLEREPALVTFAPLTEGWLVQVSFNGKIPKYLQRSRAVSRADIEHVVEDPEAVRAWLSEHLLATVPSDDADGAGSELPEAARGLQQLTFDGLNSKERFLVHEAAEDLGLPSTSRGVGASRQLIVRRPAPTGEADGEEEGEEDEDEGFGPQGWTKEADPPTGLERSPGPRTNRERRGE